MLLQISLLEDLVLTFLVVGTAERGARLGGVVLQFKSGESGGGGGCFSLLGDFILAVLEVVCQAERRQGTSD